MVVRTSYKIDYPYDRLNKKGKRTIYNTPRGAFNCGGYALNTISWYCPYSRCDVDFPSLYMRLKGDYRAVLEYTVEYMLNEFNKRLRVIQSLDELQEGEEVIGYRIATNGFDFHYIRRKSNGSWYGKRGACPWIEQYTTEQAFDSDSAAWGYGNYNSEMILFAIIVEQGLTKPLFYDIIHIENERERNQMIFISKEELAQIRAQIAINQGLEHIDEVRCRRCQHWGFNQGKIINHIGQSRCMLRKEKTDSYQWCKKFLKTLDKSKTI